MEKSSILIVDDNREILDLLETLLSNEGYEALVCTSGEEAFEFLDRRLPDLILLDIHLPGINGFGVREKLQQRSAIRDIPVIFMTGDSNRESIQRSFEAGGVDYISKPFMPIEVLSRINIALDNVRAKRILKEVNRDLEKRVRIRTKELALLFSVAKLASKSAPLGDILQSTVGAISDKYYSELKLIPVINYRQKVYRTNSIPQGKRLIAVDLKSGTDQVGSISIYTSHETPADVEDTVGETVDLLEAIASEVGNIIEQKEAEENLKNQWKYFRSLWESSPEGIVTLDHKRRITDINSTFEHIFGYSLKDLRNRQLDDFILPARLRREGQNISKKIMDGQNILINSIRKTKSGKEIHCSVIGAPVNLDNRQKDYFLIYRDITKEKELEVQLMQANKMEAIGQLAAGIAHEINTPTQYVNSNTEFLSESLPELFALLEKLILFYRSRDGNKTKTPQHQDIETGLEQLDLPYLKREVQAALDDSLDGLRKISVIVDAMRTFSHPDNNEKQETEINDIIRKTITVSRNEWKYYAEVQTDLEEPLRPIMIFPDQISQVILNLIINAAHAIQDVYHKGNRKKGRILLATRAQDEQLEIRVSDNGTGIPENIRDKIFNPFFTTKEIGKGTGQGLSLVYNVVVEKHRGQVDFKTAVGKGSTFIVQLPYLN